MNLRMALAVGIIVASLPAWPQALERDRQQLPPKYSGASASAIYNTVASQAKKLKLGKDEFESTYDYENRRKGLSVPGVDLVNRVGFFVSQGDVKSAIKYDADRKEIMVAFPMRETSLYGDGKVIRLESKKVASSTYIGSNAFGVKKQIVQSVKHHYGIQFDWRIPRDKFDTIYFQIGMEPDEARAEMKNIAIFASGIINPPFVAEDTSYISPTIDSPFEEANVDKKVILRDAELWVVNRATGKVLAINRSW